MTGRWARSAVLWAAAFAAACGGRPIPSDAPEAVRAALAACGSLSAASKQACYEERLLAELERGGVGPALDLLGAIGAADVDVQRDGHVYTHAIGIEAYSPAVPVTDVFEQCSTLYQSGCYHGVIQAHFLAEGAARPESVRDLCRPYATDPGERWLFFQCLHGLGHGLTMFYGHDLPRALVGCDELTTGWDRESCYGGAFMENVVNATHPHHPASEMARTETASDAGSARDAEGADPGERESESHGDTHDHGAVAASGDAEPFQALRADDPHYPCSILEDRYLTACYLMQTSVMLWHNDGDVGHAARSCAEAPEAWRPTCFQSLGRDVSSRTLQDPGAGLRECGEAPEAYREWCYVGLVKNYVDLTATTDAGFAFCARVEASAKPRCHEAMGEEIAVLHGTPEARRTACAASESPDLERACRRGARIPLD